MWIPSATAPLNMVREMRATVALCKNTSDVRTKGDCAGGIVGRAVSGALVRNENYGDINADEGEMAGGIAGSSTEAWMETMRSAVCTAEITPAASWGRGWIFPETMPW